MEKIFFVLTFGLSSNTSGHADQVSSSIGRL